MKTLLHPIYVAVALAAAASARAQTDVDPAQCDPAAGELVIEGKDIETQPDPVAASTKVTIGYTPRAGCWETVLQPDKLGNLQLLSRTDADRWETSSRFASVEWDGFPLLDKIPILGKALHLYNPFVGNVSLTVPKINPTVHCLRPNAAVCMRLGSTEQLNYMYKFLNAKAKENVGRLEADGTAGVAFDAAIKASLEQFFRRQFEVGVVMNASDPNYRQRVFKDYWKQVVEVLPHFRVYKKKGATTFWVRIPIEEKGGTLCPSSFFVTGGNAYTEAMPSLVDFVDTGSREFSKSSDRGFSFIGTQYFRGVETSTTITNEIGNQKNAKIVMEFNTKKFLNMFRTSPSPFVQPVLEMLQKRWVDWDNPIGLNLTSQRPVDRVRGLYWQITRNLPAYEATTPIFQLAPRNDKERESTLAYYSLCPFKKGCTNWQGRVCPLEFIEGGQIARCATIVSPFAEIPTPKRLVAKHLFLGGPYDDNTKPLEPGQQSIDDSAEGIVLRKLAPIVQQAVMTTDRVLSFVDASRSSDGFDSNAESIEVNNKVTTNVVSGAVWYALKEVVSLYSAYLLCTDRANEIYDPVVKSFPTYREYDLYHPGMRYTELGLYFGPSNSLSGNKPTWLGAFIGTAADVAYQPFLLFILATQLGKVALESDDFAHLGCQQFRKQTLRFADGEAVPIPDIPPYDAMSYIGRTTDNLVAGSALVNAHAQGIKLLYSYGRRITSGQDGSIPDGAIDSDCVSNADEVKTKCFRQYIARIARDVFRPREFDDNARLISGSGGQIFKMVKSLAAHSNQYRHGFWNEFLNGHNRGKFYFKAEADGPNYGPSPNIGWEGRFPWRHLPFNSMLDKMIYSVWTQIIEPKDRVYYNRSVETMSYRAARRWCSSKHVGFGYKLASWNELKHILLDHMRPHIERLGMAGQDYWTSTPCYVDKGGTLRPEITLGDKQTAVWEVRATFEVPKYVYNMKVDLEKNEVSGACVRTDSATRHVFCGRISYPTEAGDNVDLGTLE